MSFLLCSTYTKKRSKHERLFNAMRKRVADVGIRTGKRKTNGFTY